jgi:hypothetical protein
MAEEHAQLTMSGLSRTEQLDLLDHLPPGAAEVRTDDLPPGELGEPVTALVLITLTIASLTGIGAWLSSRGKDVEMSFGIKVPGISGSFSFKAKSGETGEQMAQRIEDEHGVQVARE